jgi:hypothetical protein
MCGSGLHDFGRGNNAARNYELWIRISGASSSLLERVASASAAAAAAAALF